VDHKVIIQCVREELPKRKSQSLGDRSKFFSWNDLWPQPKHPS